MTADQNGHFSIQLPFSLADGQISLYVEVVDLAGNTSPHSNTLPLTIVSVASDYNGDSIADPALFNRTTTNQLQWLVQSTALPPATTSLPPWFVQPVVFSGTLKSGSASITGISKTAELIVGQIVTGTGIPTGTTIQSINSSTAITLSANATVSGIQSLAPAPRPTSFRSRATLTATVRPIWRTTSPAPQPGISTTHCGAHRRSC